MENVGSTNGWDLVKGRQTTGPEWSADWGVYFTGLGWISLEGRFRLFLCGSWLMEGGGVTNPRAQKCSQVNRGQNTRTFVHAGPRLTELLHAAKQPKNQPEVRTFGANQSHFHQITFVFFSHFLARTLLCDNEFTVFVSS